MGLTLSTFNFTVARVEFGINEKKYLAEKAAIDTAKAAKEGTSTASPSDRTGSPST